MSINYSFVLCYIFPAALTQKPKDVMLGTVKIPLVDLIHKRTGMLHSQKLLPHIKFSVEHTVTVFLFANIKVFLAGLECIYHKKRAPLSTSTSWSEDSRSL